MDKNFNDNELLLRAVYPASIKSIFWDNDKLASAAFIDPKGLSVNRSGNRLKLVSIEHMKSNFKGYIISLTVLFCNNIKTHLIYDPSKHNLYHSEIHGSDTSIVLDDIQARLMSKYAKVEYKPEINVYLA